MHHSISVVINTLNRAELLPRTLSGLGAQDYDRVEVIVVNGPSTDATADVLATWPLPIKVVSCPEAHLGRSRNLGIEAAAGDIVAFIDDDAVPRPTWLSRLVAAYDDSRVGGVGGFVIDADGRHWQYRYSVADRTGGAFHHVEPPLDSYVSVGADPFLYLQGTNCSFRREALDAVGGFDEEIEYYLDETDLCMRIIDAGWALRVDPAAVVHHYYRSGADRPFFSDPSPVVKNRWYFAAKNHAGSPSLRPVLRDLDQWTQGIEGVLADAVESGIIEASTGARHRESINAAAIRGLSRGANSASSLGRFTDVPARPWLGHGNRPRAAVVEIVDALADADGTESTHVVVEGWEDSAVRYEKGRWIHVSHQVPQAPSAAAGRLGGILREILRIDAGFGGVSITDRRTEQTWPWTDLLAADPAERPQRLLAIVGELSTGSAAWAEDVCRVPGVEPVLVDRLVEALDLDSDAFLGRVFDTLLGRSPSRHDRAIYEPHLVSRPGRIGIIRTLATSTEARRRSSNDGWLRAFAELVQRRAFDLFGEACQRDDEAFLSALYRVVLDREPDDEGRHAYLHQLRHGVSRESLVRTVGSSPEGAQRGFGRVDVDILLSRLADVRAASSVPTSDAVSPGV